VLECEWEADKPFRMPEGHFPVLVGVNDAGQNVYIGCNSGGWYPIVEGRPVPEASGAKESGFFRVLVLAFEPTELLGVYGLVPDHGLDPTGPFYWCPAIPTAAVLDFEARQEAERESQLKLRNYAELFLSDPILMEKILGRDICSDS